MFKFRSETWSRKIDHEREWSTCYSDVIRGYGKFLGKNLIHLRKVPRGRQPTAPRYPPVPGPVGPRVDHMWEALARKGIASYGHSRQKLGLLLRARHKRRLAEHQRANDADRERPSKDKETKINRYKPLPDLKSGKNTDGRTDLLTPRDVTIKLNQRHSATWQREAEVTSADDSATAVYHRRGQNGAYRSVARMRTPSRIPEVLPRAGLPTSWKQKSQNCLSVPGHDQTQPALSTRTLSRNPERCAGLNSMTPLPEIRHSHSRADIFRNLHEDPSAIKTRYPLPEIQISKPGPDISYLTDKSTTPSHLNRRFILSRSEKPRVVAV